MSGLAEIPWSNASRPSPAEMTSCPSQVRNCVKVSRRELSSSTMRTDAIRPPPAFACSGAHARDPLRFLRWTSHRLLQPLQQHFVENPRPGSLRPHWAQAVACSARVRFRRANWRSTPQSGDTRFARRRRCQALFAPVSRRPARHQPEAALPLAVAQSDHPAVSPEEVGGGLSINLDVGRLTAPPASLAS